MRKTANRIQRFLLCAAVLVTSAAAQNGAGAGAPPAALEPGARSSYVSTGVSVSSTFDDNIFNIPGNTGKTFDELVSINPHIQLQMDRPLTNWLVNYAPSFSFSQNAPQYSTNSELLSNTFSHKFTPRWNTSLFGNFSITTTGYDQLQAAGANQNVPLAQRPNGSLLVPGIRRQQSVSGGDVSYALDKHSNVTIGGSYTSSSFGQQGTAVNLTDTASYSGQLGYSHQRSATNTLGVDYSITRLTANDGAFDLLSHKLSLTTGFTLSAAQHLTLFAGPEVSQSSGVMPFGGGAANFNSLSWTAGGAYTLLAGKNKIDLSAVRQVSDGAGISPAVRLMSATLNLEHPFARLWLIDLSAQYAVNDPLASETGPRSYQFWSAEAGVTRKFTSGMSISLAYWRTQQNGILTAILPPGDINHNRAVVTVAYDFMHPLGK